MGIYKTRSLFLLVFFSCFDSHASDISQGRERGISPSNLVGDEIRINRTAQKSTGHFLGLKGPAKLRKFRVNECSFSYEKGMRAHPTNRREYKYERFMISFTGVDAKGESSFDSVTYGHSDYRKDFTALDLSKSFDYRDISRVELPKGSGVRRLKATRNEMGALSMTFRHSEAYSTGNSSFFVKGEKRDYHVVITFSRFDSKKIVLDRVKVKATRKLSSQGRVPEVLAEVSCSDYKNTES